MITIEKDIPIKHRSKYHKYIQAMIDMKKDESFVVNDYKIIDALRNYAWRKRLFNVAFREIKKVYHKNRRLKEVVYRIWKL